MASVDLGVVSSAVGGYGLLDGLTGRGALEKMLLSFLLKGKTLILSLMRRIAQLKARDERGPPCCLS